MQSTKQFPSNQFVFFFSIPIFSIILFQIQMAQAPLNYFFLPDKFIQLKIQLIWTYLRWNDENSNKTKEKSIIIPGSFSCKSTFLVKKLREWLSFWGWAISYLKVFKVQKFAHTKRRGKKWKYHV